MKILGFFLILLPYLTVRLAIWLVLLPLFVAFIALWGGLYAVSFVIKIITPRGEDKLITKQVSNVEADTPAKAFTKAYLSLLPSERDAVVRHYMTRIDQE